MKKLLVASVYAPSERNQTWLDLQLRFLRKTVGSFDLAVYLNRVDPADFPGTLHMNRPTPAPPEVPAGRKSFVKRAFHYVYNRLGYLSNQVETEHSRSLSRVLDYFRQHREYENYLILDSDAFPFREGWLERLLTWMEGDANTGKKQFAAAVRTENLDTFPHPCVFFMKGSFLDRVRFGFGGRLSSPSINLAGRKVWDVGSAINPVVGGRHVWLPLLRSNTWNPHPVLSGTYGGLFYHHGAGSRAAKHSRASQMGFMDHLISRSGHPEIEQQLYHELRADPERWLERLASGDPAWLKSA